uniref:Acyl-CoA:diacylglycerol acyltransferase 2.3 n=1 Tax=Lobosphaera incisa TaxID=312850 RepID=A0A3Q8PZB6_9CHLO|nr:acyl-CoA:diacylglycerol acyltransferase 2.3 [Lobosphaera incisa]QIT07021.1 type-2 diacylglycerol acyltransferase DGAT2C [Lobosphaera incisa]
MPSLDSLLTPFTFAAVYIFIPSVPLTHGLGLVAHCPRSAKAKHLLLYPVKGGRNHFIFQVISWAVWAAAVLVALPVVIRKPWIVIPASHVELLSGAAAVGGVFAELFMIKSLLVFDPDEDRATRKKSDTLTDDDIEDMPASPKWNRSRLPSKRSSSAAVVAMGVLWAVMGGALLLATEYLAEQSTREMYYILSGICLLIGATTTHGLGGKLRHDTAREAGAESAPSWQFFQPFRGGTWFVATQALGWVLFSLSIMGLIWLISQVAVGVAYCMRCWAWAVGAAMFTAQLVLGMSVLTFNARPLSRKVLSVVGPVKPIRRVPWLTAWLPILMFYTPIHCFVFVLTLTFMVMPPNFAVAFWVGSLIMYYSLTSGMEPHHTGRRQWPACRKWLTANLQDSLESWFGSVEVVREGDQPLDPNGKYIFGYQPHGLFPIGAAYLPLMPAWAKLFPGINPVTLIASVVFHTPLIRDLCSWSGLRQVSRRTFIHTLSERGSVVLVPGGQAELVHTWRMFQKRQWVCYTKHRGFIRLAIEQGASLVPIVVFGEINALRNLISIPQLQQWTYKKIGFPVPYLLVGRWGISPLPSQTGLKFVIGEPIAPPKHEPGTPVDDAPLKEMHDKYYEAVAALFTKHKPSFPSYADVELVMA